VFGTEANRRRRRRRRRKKEEEEKIERKDMNTSMRKEEKLKNAIC
jgi:hypothetical protein